MQRYRMQIASNGRMASPMGVRQQPTSREESLPIIRKDEGRLMLKSVGGATRRAQALVRHYAPQADGVTDELLAERRADAARD